MLDLAQFKRNNKFLMLAFDHRGSFKKLMNGENPDQVSDEQAIELKKEIIAASYGEISSLLIDQDFGLSAYKQLIEQGFEEKPYLMPLEKTGYESSGKERLTVLEKSAAQLKEMGASGAKLLLFYNPYATSALDQQEIAKKAVEDCRKNDLPFFLEPRTYNNEGLEADKMEGEEREKIAILTLKQLVGAGILPDVYKLEYPGSALHCQTYTAILDEPKIPWIMLTMGAEFEEFAKELEEAVTRGCQGYLAGRAVWQEAPKLTGEAKREFLEKTLVERLKKLSQIASRV